MSAYRYSSTLLARSGSFWRTSVADSERDKIQSLLSSCGCGSHMEGASRVEALASGRPDTETGSFGLRFARTDVEDLSGYMSEALDGGFLDASGVAVEAVVRPAPSGDAYVVDTQAGYLLLFNAGNGVSPLEPAWSVLVPANLHVQAVRAMDGRIMHAGLDFSQGRGVLVFREPVFDLFPSGTIPVEAATREILGLRHHLFGAPALVPGTGVFLMRCANGLRSHGALLRAAAEYAGYYVVQRPGHILGTEVGAGFVRYATDHGVFVAGYPHTPLPAGPVVEGTMAGCTARVVQDNAPRWWSPALNNGFSLDNVCPVQGLRVPAGLMRVALYTHSSGHLCTKLWLEGEDADLEAYWDLVAASEARTGNLLGSHAGLVADGDAAMVQGSDFMLETALDGHVAVFETGGVDPARKIAMEAFLLENRPATKGVVFV